VGKDQISSSLGQEPKWSWCEVVRVASVFCQGNTNPKGQGHTNRASARRTLREIEIEIEIEIGI